MATAPAQLDILVTEDKIFYAVERIVKVADPVRIIAFGSRARGDFRPDSDLDLAVIVDHLPPRTRPPVTHSALDGIVMPIDLLVFDQARHDKAKAWVDSVHYDIEHQGLLLYNREDGRRTDRRAVACLVGR